MTDYLYKPDLVYPSDAGVLFDVLWKDGPAGLWWEKRSDAPRKECWMNDFDRPYTYGRGAGVRTYEARPWHYLVLYLREKLKKAGYGYFEGCFANGYTGERDHLGWHADDDPGIDHSKPIVVVSFGAAREIQVREKSGRLPYPGETRSFMLEPGSIFVMPAGSQFTHQHRIPKVGHKVGPRLSLTFRGLKP